MGKPHVAFLELWPLVAISHTRFPIGIFSLPVLVLLRLLAANRRPSHWIMPGQYSYASGEMHAGITFLRDLLTIPMRLTVWMT